MQHAANDREDLADVEPELSVAPPPAEDEPYDPTNPAHTTPEEHELQAEEFLANAVPWHLAGSLVSLKAAVDRHWPKRDRRSDGGIGDARHRKAGRSSDHNPWLNNTVRAYDFDVDGINAPWLAEQLRTLGHLGDPRLAGGGYVILNGRITAPDFSHWTEYNGADPHTTHLHVSVTRNAPGYEYGGAWSFLDVAPHPPASPRPKPAPAPAPAAGDPDRDGRPGPGPHAGNPAAAAPEQLPPPRVDERDEHPAGVGHGGQFRAQYGDAGPAIAALQRGLNERFPLYSRLVVDGAYGGETAAVLREFAHRIAESDPGCPKEDRPGLAEADGYTVGPRLARALHRLGIRT